MLRGAAYQLEGLLVGHAGLLAQADGVADRGLVGLEPGQNLRGRLLPPCELGAVLLDGAVVLLERLVHVRRLGPQRAPRSRQIRANLLRPGYAADGLGHLGELVDALRRIGIGNTLPQCNEPAFERRELVRRGEDVQ